MKPKYIDEAIATCVQRVSEALLTQLQQTDNNITGVHFQQGHPLEIIKELQVLSKGTTTKTERYPLVGLFRDFKEVEGRTKYIVEVPQLKLIIAVRTQPTYKTIDRREKSFKPILHPIYEELKKQMRLSGFFLIDGELNIEKLDRYFWGREEIYGSKANVFEDWIDCIELTFTNLKTYLTC